jgi:hypothetical protein
MNEITVALSTLPRRRPAVPNIHVGQVVSGVKYGRRFKVLATDEWVVINDKATGPYARLQALDDKHCRVIWPRAWYTAAGQQLALDLEVAA